MQSLRKNRVLAIIASLLIVTASIEVFSFVKTDKENKKKEEKGTPVLWRNPGDMRKRDLYYGPGSEDLAPKPPFKFVKEVKEGGMPKFDVEDARGVKWRVKLGEEAQAETVASRLVWAAGYNADESYYLKQAQIDGLKKLSRGQKYVQGNSVIGARFESRRDNVKRGKEWSWRDNPFKNTRELNGLKTMMVLVNNWDVFKKNNKIIHDKDTGEARYTVTDLGASMGAAAGIGGGRSKNNVRDYTRARFVKKVDGDQVKFNYDLKPKKLGLLSVVYPPYFIRQHKATKTMNKVPVSDAAWIGSKMAELSDDQLRDAFRAAGYDRGTQDAYVRALRTRINDLAKLSDVGSASRQRRAIAKR
jgi:hypothetical protein